MLKPILILLLIGAAPWCILNARAAQSATQPALDLGNQLSLKLVLIPAGKFIMGSPANEKGHAGFEGPQHQVSITKSFYMGISPVTQEQYEAIMGDNPSARKGPTRPVERLSWSQAVDFCKKVSEKSGKAVRLPTEAEWEYACRAGTTTAYSFGDSEKDLDDYAWIARNSGDNTFPVCQKKPNPWGLYDMHGNVIQWCSDWLAQPYPSGDAVDPQGPDSGKFKVMRGGCYSDGYTFCRSACRRWEPPGHTSPGVGFRVVVESK